MCPRSVAMVSLPEVDCMGWFKTRDSGDFAITGTVDNLTWLQQHTDFMIRSVVSPVFIDEGIVQYQYIDVLEKYKSLLLRRRNKCDLKTLRELGMSLNGKLPIGQNSESVDRARNFCNAAVTTLIGIPLFSMYWNVALGILGFPEDFDGYVQKEIDIPGLKIESMGNLHSVIRRELEEFVDMASKYPDIPSFLYRVGLYEFPFERMHDDGEVDLKVWWSYFDERFHDIESVEPSVIREFFQPFHGDFNGNIVMPPISVKSLPALVWRTIKEGYYWDFRDVYKLIHDDHAAEFPHLPNEYSDPEGPAILSAIATVVMRYIREVFIAKLKTSGVTDDDTNAEVISAYLNSIQPFGTYMTLANEIFIGTILKGSTMDERNHDFSALEIVGKLSKSDSQCCESTNIQLIIKCPRLALECPWKNIARMCFRSRVSTSRGHLLLEIREWTLL